MLEYYNNPNELRHYGVLGMKWGVHRATKQLSKATTADQRGRAISKLNKHRTKATNKIAQLGKKHVKLQRDYDANIIKTNVKAGKLDAKAAKYENKRYGMFVSQKKSEQYAYKAAKYKAQAERLKTLSAKTEARLRSNEKTTELFKRGVSTIDAALVSAGEKRLKSIA